MVELRIRLAQIATFALLILTCSKETNATVLSTSYTAQVFPECCYVGSTAGEFDGQQSTDGSAPASIQPSLMGEDVLGSLFAEANFSGLQTTTSLNIFPNNGGLTSGAFTSINASLMDTITVGSVTSPIGSPVLLNVTFSLMSATLNSWVSTILDPLNPYGGYLTGSGCDYNILGTCQSGTASSTLTLTDVGSGVVITSGQLLDNGIAGLNENGFFGDSLTLGFSVNVGDSFNILESLTQTVLAELNGPGQAPTDLQILTINYGASDPIFFDVLTPGAYYTTQSGMRYGIGGLPPPTIPEPDSILLVGIGIAGLAFRRRTAK